MPDAPSNGRNGGWITKAAPLLVAGSVTAGGGVGIGWQVNSAKIASNQEWLARVETHNKEQDVIIREQDEDLTMLRLELDAAIKKVQDGVNAQLEHMVPMTLSRDRIERFQTDMDQLERLLGARQDRMQAEINAVRDRIGSRRGPDER